MCQRVVIQLILWIVDSGCSKHMTGNLSLLRNFIEKFIGTVRFGNDHFALITGYGDYNLEGDDLLTGSREFNLYTISISEFSYLNFGTINQLTSKDVVDGLLKFKYDKDHLYLACEQGKSKKASFPPTLVPSTESKLELLHMDLCGPMRVESINGKKYILVFVDDYSRYTLVYFLRTKDEAPDMIINFINQVQRTLKAQILKIRTDNGTEFKNEKLRSFYAKLGIVHHTSIARTPQQTSVFKCRNHTLVEVARTMLIFSKSSEFLWAKAIAIACFTQNRSIVHTQYNKTPYELIRGRKPNVQYFHVFRSLYSESYRGFRIYNRRTKKIMETIHVKFDELTAMASECNNSRPGLNCSNFQDSSEQLNKIPSQQDLDNLFGIFYEEDYAPSTSKVSNNSAANTLDDEDTPSPSSIIVEESNTSQIVTSSKEPFTQESSTPVLETQSDEQIQEDIAEFDGNTIMHSFEILKFGEAKSSSNY
ncbi:retrovirus-related pol polyprotein from transposon TNT 1-94 [Tanacetum coccineum]